MTMRSVWAVARNTIAQAVRMKIAVVIIVLLVILLPLMSMIIVGDGTLVGKLQTFVSYGLSLTAVLMSLLSITVACFTLTSELKRKQIFLVVTKPISRYKILLGKLLGVILLDAVLLGIFSGIIYGLTIYMPAFAGAEEFETAKAGREFYIARKSLTESVNEAEIKKAALRNYEKLDVTGQLPDGMNRARVLAELIGREKLKAKSVEPGGRKTWTFNDIDTSKVGESIFVRYKYQVSSNPPDMGVFGVWAVGDYRQFQFGPGNQETPIYPVARKDTVKTITEFEVPADAITPEGFLGLVFENPFVNQITVIPEDVEVLIRAGSFTANFVRVVLMIFCRLIFLAVLGISVSTWVSFPVAMFVCVSIFLIGMVNGFIVESLDSLGKEAQIFYMFMVKPVMWLLPRFDGDFDPVHFMVSARILGWGLLIKVLAIMVFIKSSLIFLCGMWIFSNRELAKTTA
jgi:hypothetical protein